MIFQIYNTGVSKLAWVVKIRWFDGITELDLDPDPDLAVEIPDLDLAKRSGYDQIPDLDPQYWSQLNICTHFRAYIFIKQCKKVNLTKTKLQTTEKFLKYYFDTACKI